MFLGVYIYSILIVCVLSCKEQSNKETKHAPRPAALRIQTLSKTFRVMGNVRQFRGSGRAEGGKGPSGRKSTSQLSPSRAGGA